MIYSFLAAYRCFFKFQNGLMGKLIFKTDNVEENYPYFKPRKLQRPYPNLGSWPFATLPTRGILCMDVHLDLTALSQKSIDSITEYTTISLSPVRIPHGKPRRYNKRKKRPECNSNPTRGDRLEVFRRTSSLLLFHRLRYMAHLQIKFLSSRYRNFNSHD